MKVLVLSCNTGQGHNSAAKAVQEKMISLHHECDFKDALAYSSKRLSDSISTSYDKIVLHTPKAFGIGYRFSKSMTYKQGELKSPFYAMNMSYSKKLYDDIVDGGYDAVVCTHVFAAQAVTHAKHKYGLDVPLYAVATDYSLCPFYDELDVDMCFISTAEVIKEYTDRGISIDKICPSGIPISERFEIQISKEEARAKLGINNNRFLCLIMSGSMGFGNIYKLIDQILEKLPVPDYDILVIAGKNHKLMQGINEKYAKHDNIAAIGYTNEVHLFMKASDVVITKPGGLSSTEAMVTNVPLILTKPIPGCETENYELLTSLNAALEGKDIEKAVSAVCLLKNDKTVSDILVNNQKKYINKTASTTICSHIIEKYNENKNT